MLHAFKFWNFHQVTNGFVIEDLTVRCEYPAEFKCQDVLKASANFPVHSRFFFCRLMMESRRLKQNWDCICARNQIKLPAIERNYIAALVLDVSSGHKRPIST